MELQNNSNTMWLLDKNEIDYTQVIEGLDVAVYVCDRNGLITYYNSAAVSLWGREPELGKDLWYSLWKIFRLDGTFLPLDESPMTIVLKEGMIINAVEIIVQRSDGSRRYVQPHPKPIFNSSGDIVGAVNMLIDITDKKAAEKLITESEQKFRLLADSLEKTVEEKTQTLVKRTSELEKSEERYHKMVEEVQDYAILLLDKYGIVLNWNKGAEKIKGYKEEEIVGKSFKTFYLPIDLENKVPDKLMAEAELKGRAAHEGWRKRKDGTTFWGSVVITALHDEQNNVIGFSKVTRDLTEVKRTADRLKQYTHELEFQNKELEQFAYIASHDLQEPLRKIQTFSQALDGKLDDKLLVQTYLGKINSSANRMSTLIKDVLNYSRLSKENFVEVNLNEVINNVREDFEVVIAQKNVIINSSKLPLVKGNVIQLRQLFSNLLSNAIKFCDKQPVIDITSEKASVKEISNYFQLSPEMNYVKIIFKDNGIGFSQQYAEQIFQLFQRLNNDRDGNGMGLTICKKIVENHNGHITVSSEKGKGAMFNIYLPV